jgi:hypothetical protein
MDLQTVSIHKFGGRSFLVIGDKNVEVQDYKISSSMRGCTELEVTFQIEECEITEFGIGAKKESFQPQSLRSKNDVP